MKKEKILIRTSKKVVIIGLLGSFAFVMIGITMITNPDLVPRYSEFFTSFWGIIGAGFFGLTFLYLLKKMFDNKPGMMLDENGLYNNSSIISHHTVRWDELSGAGLTKIGKEKIIFIYFKDDKEFIKKFNLFEQILMRLNLAMNGSPIGISSRTLNYDIDRLNRQIQYRIKNWAQQSLKKLSYPRG